jgi:hypothetical protein
MKTLKQIRDAEPFGTTDIFGERPTFKDVYPTFDDWWRAVGLHAAARDIDIDFDQESWRECYEDELEPWEAVEG